MKRNRVVLVLLSMLMLLAFVSCDGNKASLDGAQVSPYKKVTLSDLKPFESMVTADENITDWPTTNLKRETSMIEDGFHLIVETLENIYEGNYDSITPLSARSIDAGLHLFIKDEGFRITKEASESISAFFSEVDIKNLDLKLNGYINSLSDLLALFIGEDNFELTSALSADGRVQISAKIRSLTNYKDKFDSLPMKEYATVMSLFVDLGISGSLPLEEGPTGLLSGKIQFSMGSNLASEYNETTGKFAALYHNPVVLSIDLAPFKNVDLISLQQLFQEDPTRRETGSDPVDPWPVLKELIWPGASGPVVTVTRTIGNFDATEARVTTVWEDAEALELLFPHRN